MVVRRQIFVFSPLARVSLAAVLAVLVKSLHHESRVWFYFLVIVFIHKCFTEVVLEQCSPCTGNATLKIFNVLIYGQVKIHRGVIGVAEVCDGSIASSKPRLLGCCFMPWSQNCFLNMVLLVLNASLYLCIDTAVLSIVDIGTHVCKYLSKIDLV